MTTFDPIEHPRAAGGQFTTKPRAEADFMLRAGHGPAAVEHLRAVARILGNGDESDRDELPSLRFAGRAFVAGRGAMPFGDRAMPVPGPDGVARWEFHVEDMARGFGEGDRYTTVVRSDLPADADPAAVAAWLQEQMDTHGTPDTREERSEYERWTQATQRVADLLPSNQIDHDGDAPAIFFGSRQAADNYGDYAFLRPPGAFTSEPHLDLHWQFATEEFDEPLPSGDFARYEVAEHLTVDSDPHDVAAWIRARMHKHGTPPLTVRRRPVPHISTP